MYIIVSTSMNYKGKMFGEDCITRANTIGHEIHLTRVLLFYLLTNNFITEDDTIVTKSKERFFFYSKIFKNIIEYDSMPENVEDKDILDLTQANSMICKAFLDENKDIEMTDMEQKMPVLYGLRKNKKKIRTKLLDLCLSSFDYPSIDFGFLSNKFVVIHQRHVSYNDVGGNDIVTKNLLLLILTQYPDITIVIFSINPIDIESDKIIHVSDIPTYASLMNHPNCQAVISEFSGAGQLAQYCHHKNILYYFASTDFKHNFNLEELIKNANHPNNIYYSFDLKKTTNSNIFVYTHLFEMISNILKDNYFNYSNDGNTPLYLIPRKTLDIIDGTSFTTKIGNNIITIKSIVNNSN